jgi:hypothetical protein
MQAPTLSTADRLRQALRLLDAVTDALNEAIRQESVLQGEITLLRKELDLARSSLNLHKEV